MHAGHLDPALQVAQHLVELFLARHHLGQVELAANFVGGVKKVHLMAALGQHGGRRQAGRAGADHGETAARRRAGDWAVDQLGLVAGARVDQAAGELVFEDVVQAGLVAGDACVDLVGLTGGGFFHKVRVGQQGTRHRHHVRLAVGQHLLGHLRRVDAVAGNQRRVDAGGGKFGLHLVGQPGKGGARHAGGNGRHPGLVPADAGVDQAGAAARHGLAQGYHFVPAAAAWHQVDHGQPVDQDEVRAHRLAGARHDLQRQPHALAVVAAPFVAALVGLA